MASTINERLDTGHSTRSTKWLVNMHKFEWDTKNDVQFPHRKSANTRKKKRKEKKTDNNNDTPTRNRRNPSIDQCFNLCFCHLANCFPPFSPLSHRKCHRNFFFLYLFIEHISRQHTTQNTVEKKKLVRESVMIRQLMCVCVYYYGWMDCGCATRKTVGRPAGCRRVKERRRKKQIDTVFSDEYDVTYNKCLYNSNIVFLVGRFVVHPPRPAILLPLPQRSNEKHTQQTESSIR